MRFLATGVWLVVDGQMANEPMLPLVSVLALAAFSPVTELARTMKQMMETLAASRRILEVHDEPKFRCWTGPARMAPVDGELSADSVASTFQDVGFAYTARRSAEALAGVSFEVGVRGRLWRSSDVPERRQDDDAPT